MIAYYNEFDPFAAAWLRQLIAGGHIAPGDVDERSITEVKADDLKKYTQCHFFAGIGGWSLALRLAGWPDDRPVWTGSCPCQPFSAAGKQEGKADDRHLWPVWFRLIREQKPAVIFGEQVASAIAHQWLDEVAHDLEDQSYAVASAVLPACSVGAPHKRDRLWFVGHSAGEGSFSSAHAGIHRGQESRGTRHVELERSGGNVANADQPVASEGRQQRGGQFSGISGDQGHSIVGESFQSRLEGLGEYGDEGNQPGRLGAQENGSIAAPGIHAGYDNLEWIGGPDGKARPVKLGIRLLAHGVSNRVGKLRGYGNAIVPQVAQAFIETVMEII